MPEKVGLVTTYRCCWRSESQNSSINVVSNYAMAFCYILNLHTHINERIFPWLWSFASHVPHYSSTNEKA